MKETGILSQRSKPGSNGSGKKIRRKTGIIIMIAGILTIFISSLLNAIQNECFDAASQVSRNVFIFDIISTFGVLLIPWSLFLIMHREAAREEPKPSESYLCSKPESQSAMTANWN